MGKGNFSRGKKKLGVFYRAQNYWRNGIARRKRRSPERESAPAGPAGPVQGKTAGPVQGKTAGPVQGKCRVSAG